MTRSLRRTDARTKHKQFPPRVLRHVSYQSNVLLLISIQMTTKFITPKLAEFPRFLKSIEQKWKGKLARRFERERFAAEKDQRKPTRYILSMFPYPSGRLHLGHVRIYTSGDILSRFSKLLCKNARLKSDYDHVVYPMGFDSFGLPAENAAKERGLHPAVWTNSNIRTMKKQLDDLALQFNWREATSNPTFYKWTQDIFLKLMDAGLVYKSFAQVNWDPIDKTVLADEQVDEDGRSWRSGAFIQKRFFRQWFVKVNAFTSNIYQAEDIDPETWQDILTIQRNWIGKPDGWIFYLPVSSKSVNTTDLLPIYTKTPELFTEDGTELIVSKDHWLVEIFGLTELKNPMTGGYLTIKTTDDSESLPRSTKATLINNSICDTGSSCLKRDHVLLQAKLNNLGGYYTSDSYRDWLVSRQRFWGTPIPVTNCVRCGYQGVARDKLPVPIPSISNLVEQQSPESTNSDDKLQVKAPIEKLAPQEWLETKCRSCGSQARRECETLDTLFDSSWYFLRYVSEPLTNQLMDRDKVQPVWCYIGGKEHASMHLFYARFVTHFLHSIGELNFREPFKSLLVQGVVKSRTYKLNGKYISKEDALSIEDKGKLVAEYEKMSKSKGNGVDPQDLLDTYGIDATRFCLVSYANPKSERLWRNSEEEFKDVLNYLRRVFLTIQEYIDIGAAMLEKGDKLRSKVSELGKEELEQKQSLLVNSRNRCSIDATFNIQETYQLRQYISALHVFTTVLRNNIRNSSVYTKEFAEALASLIVMLNPIVPHLSEELWALFSRAIINPLRNDPKSRYNMSLQVSDQAWPIPDEDYGRSRCFKSINTYDQ